MKGKVFITQVVLYDLSKIAFSMSILMVLTKKTNITYIVIDNSLIGESTN